MAARQPADVSTNAVVPPRARRPHPAVRMRGPGENRGVTTSIAPPLRSDGTPPRDARATLRVGVVSTYPPRACGIGTFSRDLRDALLGADASSAVDVAADRPRGRRAQAPEVVTRSARTSAATTLRRRARWNGAATSWSSSSTSTASSAATTGAHVLSLRGAAAADGPDAAHRPVGAGCARPRRCAPSAAIATLVCVFTETARRMIVAARLVSPDRVRVVPHGGPPSCCPSAVTAARLPPGVGATDADRTDRPARDVRPDLAGQGDRDGDRGHAGDRRPPSGGAAT